MISKFHISHRWILWASIQEFKTHPEATEFIETCSSNQRPATIVPRVQCYLGNGKMQPKRTTCHRATRSPCHHAKRTPLGFHSYIMGRYLLANRSEFSPSYESKSLQGERSLTNRINFRGEESDVINTNLVKSTTPTLSILYQQAKRTTLIYLVQC